MLMSNTWTRSLLLVTAITICSQASVQSQDDFAQRTAQVPAAETSANDLNATIEDPLASLGEGEDDLDALLDLEIDDLGKVQAVTESFDVEVTSVTRGKSTIGKSPAAVFVITPEMIKRSGATTVPDLLRMVPGMQVARNNASRFAISSRGGNGVFANKLLVLVDGRSIYTPLFGGVYWEVEDMVLQDIQRIEVIRGPGATVWGANAVNGVVNIITKSAQETQGTLITAGGGDQDKTITQFRHGDVIDKDLYYRVWGKYRDHRDGAGGAHDDWRFGRLGMRLDWTPDDSPDSFTLLGQIYDGRQGTITIDERIATPPFLQTQVRDEEPNGANLLARWTHQIDEDDSWTAQFYYDRLKLNNLGVKFSLDIFDLDFQHRLRLDDVHRLSWGMGYRHYGDNVDPVNTAHLNARDTSRVIERVGAFIQDEAALSDDMNLIIGSKFSYNDLSGYEYQPSIRLNYSPDATHSLWGAVSRAVKTPTRIEDDLFLAQLAALGPVFAVITGNRRLEAEDLTAFEIGYRVQESEDIAWDISLFWNHYEDLVGLVAAGPPTGLPPSFPLVFRNNARGDAYGFELNGTVQMTDDWQIRAWYSLLQLDNVGEGTNPTNSAYAMSSWNLSEELEFDLIARYVDSLPSQKIDSYFTLDARIGFSPANDLYLSVVGQNLLDSTHPEFRETYALASSSEVRRGVYAQLEWRY